MADYLDPTAPSKLPKFPAPMPSGGLYAPPTADQIKLRQYMAGPGMQPTGAATNPEEESPAASMPAMPTSTPAVTPVPTKASDAAAEATTKALDTFGMNDRGAGYDASRPGPDNAPKTVDPNANVGGWNAFVQNQLTNMTGLPASTIQGVLAQPLPGSNKAAGEAAMNTTDGAMKRLNYGPNQEIVGSGMVKHADGRTTLSDFSGVGGNPNGAGAGGTAGMLGELAQTMRDARALRAQGKDLEAHRLEAQVARFTPAVSTSVEAPIRQQIANAETQNAQTNAGTLNLKANIAQPEFDIQSALNDLWFSNDPKKQAMAREIVAGRGGSLVKPNVVGMGQYLQGPNGQWKLMFPEDMMKK